MTSTWNYKIPRLAGSGFKSNTVTDLEHPRIGIYCEGIDGARHDLFLVGSFTVSDEVLRQSEVVHWSWESTYVTGNRYVIRLRRQAGAHAPTYLVDDEVWDPEAERKTFLDLCEEDIDGAAVAEQQARMEHANQIMRSMPDLRCRAHVAAGIHCRVKVDARNERTQDLLTLLWQEGIREVSLNAFGLAYRRVASHNSANR